MGLLGGFSAVGAPGRKSELEIQDVRRVCPPPRNNAGNHARVLRPERTGDTRSADAPSRRVYGFVAADPRDHDTRSGPGIPGSAGCKTPARGPWRTRPHAGTRQLALGPVRRGVRVGPARHSPRGRSPSFRWPTAGAAAARHRPPALERPAARLAVARPEEAGRARGRHPHLGHLEAAAVVQHVAHPRVARRVPHRRPGKRMTGAIAGAAASSESGGIFPTASCAARQVSR